MQIAAPLDHLTRHGAARLEQLAVHVDEVLAARLGVQVVDVLGHQGHPPRQQTLQPGKGVMGRIGVDLGSLQLLTARVVEALHQHGIPRIAFRRRHILNPVLFPQTVAGSKCLDAGLCRDAGAGEDHDMFG